MRLVSFNDYQPGLLIDGNVVDLMKRLPAAFSGLDWDQRMPALIESFASLRPEIEKQADATGVPVSSVQLQSPLPRPRKLLCELGDYNETIPEPKGATDFYLKSPESVVGGGATVALPKIGAEPYRARGAVATIIGRTCRNVTAAEALGYVFGYAPFIDAGTEAFGRPNIGTFFGNSFDGFGPLGPCIVTADEAIDAGSFRVRLSVNGGIVQQYGCHELHYSLPEQIEAASAIMTLRPGDVIVSGKFKHDVPGLNSGDALVLDVTGLGTLRVSVR